MSPKDSGKQIDSNHTDQYRRKFLTQSAAVAGLAIAPGIVLNQVHAKADADKVTDATRWGLLIDTNKCSKGCTDCVTACSDENRSEEHTSELQSH